MTTQTMLPPNLTRHFYEARREFLRTAGVPTTPWFQLTPMERAVTEGEVNLFREAIRRAEEEQALLTAAQRRAEAATDTTATEEPAAAEEPTAAAADSHSETSGEEDCGHPLCRVLRSLVAMLETSEPDFLDSFAASAPIIELSDLLERRSRFDRIRAW